MADARTVIESIAAIEPETRGNHSEITNDQVHEIARLFAGDHDLFYRMDSGPGRFRGYGDPDDWHWKLRQARNRTGIDRTFFDVLNERE